MKKKKSKKKLLPHSESTYMVYKYFGSLKFLKGSYEKFCLRALEGADKSIDGSTALMYYNRFLCKLDEEITAMGNCLSYMSRGSMHMLLHLLARDLNLPSGYVIRNMFASQEEILLMSSFLKQMISKLYSLKSKFILHTGQVLASRDRCECSRLINDFIDYMAEIELFHKEKYLQSYESWI